MSYITGSEAKPLKTFAEGENEQEEYPAYQDDDVVDPNADAGATDEGTVFVIIMLLLFQYFLALSHNIMDWANRALKTEKRLKKKEKEQKREANSKRQANLGKLKQLWEKARVARIQAKERAKYLAKMMVIIGDDAKGVAFLFNHSFVILLLFIYYSIVILLLFYLTIACRLRFPARRI